MKTIGVIGASLAGVNTATALRRRGYDGKILLFGDEIGLPYDRPPLSKEFLTGEKDAAAVLLHPEEFYRSQDIDLVADTRVESVDPSLGRLKISSGRSFNVDAVVLATGGRCRRLVVPGDHLAGIHYLRTLDDAVALREALPAATRVAVVGAGFVGAEVAATARQLGKEVIVVERESRILARVLPGHLADIIADVHRGRGVGIQTDQEVAAFLGSSKVSALRLADGSTVDADLVVVGIGMVPVDELAAGAGLQHSNGVMVDQFARTSNSAVYAVGDVARFFDLRSQQSIRLEQWQHAQNHALAAAANLLGQNQPYVDTPWFWSRQYDHDIQLAGQWAGADQVVDRGRVHELKFVRLFLQGGVTIGAFGMNAGRDIRGAMALIDSSARVPVAALADTGQDLRRLAASVGAGAR